MEDTAMKRKKRPLWPWIISLLVLMLLIWLLLESMQKDEPEAVVATGTAVTEAVEPVPTATTDTADAGTLPQQVEQ